MKVEEGSNVMSQELRDLTPDLVEGDQTLFEEFSYVLASTIDEVRVKHK